MQPLKLYLHNTHITIQRWYRGQFCNDKHFGQGDKQIGGQGTVNNMVQEDHSGSTGDGEEYDKDVEGEGMV